MIGQATAILFVLLLLAGALWVLRRKGLATVNFALNKRLGREKVMQVIERMPLTAHHSLHLVRIGDRVILIGVSPASCREIESFPASYAGWEGGEGQ